MYSCVRDKTSNWGFLSNLRCSKRGDLDLVDVDFSLDTISGV